jgi:hypothetical protein
MTSRLVACSGSEHDVEAGGVQRYGDAGQFEQLGLVEL